MEEGTKECACGKRVLQFIKRKFFFLMFSALPKKIERKGENFIAAKNESVSVPCLSSSGNLEKRKLIKILGYLIILPPVSFFYKK